MLKRIPFETILLLLMISLVVLDRFVDLPTWVFLTITSGLVVIFSGKLLVSHLKFRRKMERDRQEINQLLEEAEKGK